MATTRKTTNSRSRTTTRRRAEPGIVASTERTIKRNPYASAAIATGVVSAIAASVAGFFAFKKSGKNFTDFSNDVATSVKDKAVKTTDRVKDGLADAGTRAKDKVSKLRDGLDTDGNSQSRIAEEALTLKVTGAKTELPIDPTIGQQSKIGAVS